MASSANASVNATSPWYASIEVYSSDYEPASFEPGPSVDANHNLLAGLRDNDFEMTNSSYTLGLLTLFLVFIVAGVLSCVLVPLLYRLLGKSRQERLKERMKIGHRLNHYGGNTVMVLASVAAVATAAGAVWGLQRADSGLANIESTTQDVATDLLSVLSLPTDTSVALDNVTTSYDLLRTDVDGCQFGFLLAPVLDEFDLGTFTGSVQSSIDDLNEESLDELATDVQGISDAVDDTEGFRKGVVWPVLTLALISTAGFILISIGTYECVAFGHADCDAITCCVTPCAVFVAVVIWLCAASAVALSALSGDFCVDPDTHANDLIAESSDGGQLTQLIAYYTGDCNTRNDARDAIISAQEAAVPAIQEIVPMLYSLVDQCGELLAPVRSVDASLQTLWTVLDHAGELSSCENLNTLYQTAVYDELCEDLPRGLLGFWVSCSILTVLLLILVVQWNRMLGQQTTEDDAEVAESMNRTRVSRMKALSNRFSSRRNIFSARGAAAPSSEPGVASAEPPTTQQLDVDAHESR